MQNITSKEETADRFIPGSQGNETKWRTKEVQVTVIWGDNLQFCSYE